MNQKHQVENIQETMLHIKEQMALHRAATVYGSALAMTLQTERTYLGAPNSSFIHLEMSMDRLNDLDYADYMNKKVPGIIPIENGNNIIM